jgi:hypothetical protein
MPTKNSQADRLHDCEMLLKAVLADEAELAGVALFRAALERSHAQAVSSRERRDALMAATRAATLEVNEAFAACSEAAITLRHFIRSVLGPHNEKLARYGIKPRRRRRLTRKPPAGYGLPS